jgi:hypothetical protein
MRLPLLRAVVPAALAGMAAFSAAQADVYTWVDAAGRTNVSNLDPPEGVRVTSVQRTDPARAAAAAAAREALRASEVQALGERVRELEDQVEAAARQPPPPIALNVVVAPPAPSYPPEWAPAPAYYDVPEPAPSYAGCDPSWFGCGFGWYPGIYPASVVVAGAPAFRGHRPVRGRRPPPPAAGRPIMTPFGQAIFNPVGRPLVPTVGWPVAGPVAPPTGHMSGGRRSR